MSVRMRKCFKTQAENSLCLNRVSFIVKYNSILEQAVYMNPIIQERGPAKREFAIEGYI